jgi:hypothetical protein
LGKSLLGDSAFFADAESALEASAPREALPKSRLNIYSPNVSTKRSLIDQVSNYILSSTCLGLYVVDSDFRLVTLMMRHSQIVAVQLGH